MVFPAKAGSPLQRGSYAASSIEGHFVFTTDANAALFRKVGFASERVLLTDATDLRLILRRAPIPKISLCNDAAACVHNGTWESALCFPNVAGIGVGPIQSGIDTVSREFSIARQKLHVVSGYAGSSDLAWDPRLWASAEFSESVYQAPETAVLVSTEVLDARGKTANGGYWRYVGVKPESVEYSDVPRAVAARFDALIDGACRRLDTRP